MPLGSVDSEDGNGLVDDELHTLLPGTREVSADELSQVLNILLNLISNLLKSVKPAALTPSHLYAIKGKHLFILHK